VITKPLLLVDLDDTLFQTRRKCPEADPERLIVVATAVNGSHSLMTPRQKSMVEWMLAGADVIPVTARGSVAYRNVDIPFANGAILANGALILRPDGESDVVWAKQIHDQLVPMRSILQGVLDQARSAAAEIGLDVRSWLVEEGGLATYAVIKENHGDGLNLKNLPSRISGIEGWTVHHNGNNLGIVPPQFSKSKAVEYLIDKIRHETPDRPIIGIGDSVSDLGFMRLCDLWSTPTGSQIDHSLHQKASHARNDS
jgi:hydroxymethylpyrimidine pyrophosphatase-like HAD family hydrolase